MPVKVLKRRHFGWVLKLGVQLPVKIGGRSLQVKEAAWITAEVCVCVSVGGMKWLEPRAEWQKGL